MLTVLFSCRECGLKDARAKVPARESSSVSVVWWMKEVCLPAVVAAHALLSPVCFPKELHDLKIPLDENDPDGWVGKQTDSVPPKGKVG